MTLNIELNPQEEAQFADYARRKGIDPHTLAKSLIMSLPQPVEQDDLDSFGDKSISDLMKEIGFAVGGPPDLSVNPDAFQGFGETK